MQRAPAAQKRVGPDVAVAPEQRSVGKDRILIDDAIVRDMHSAHGEHAISQPRGVLDARMCRSMHRSPFADDHIVADHNISRIFLIGREPQVLRLQAHERRRADPAPRSNDRRPMDVRMLQDHSARANRDLPLDDGICPDFGAVSYFARINDGSWMNVRQEPRLLCKALPLCVEPVLESNPLAEASAWFPA